MGQVAPDCNVGFPVSFPVMSPDWGSMQLFQDGAQSIFNDPSLPNNVSSFFNYKL